MKLNLGWILFFIFIYFLGSTVCYSKVRFEGGYGASYLNYKETHVGQESKDIEFTQQSILFDGAFRLELLGKWVTFNTEFSALTPSFGTSLDDHEADIFDLNNIIYLNFPAKPINLVMSFEYYYHKFSPSLDTFGYEDMFGKRISAILNLENSAKTVKFEARYPIFNEIAGRSELFADLYFNLSPKGGGDSSSFLFATSQYVKFGYYSGKTVFPGALPVNIDLTLLTFHWVGSW